VGREPWEVLADLGKKLFAREDFAVLFGGGWIQQERGLVRGVVKAVGNGIDVGRFQAGRIETIVDRSDREVAGVFLATEPLLGGPRDDLAVDDQDGSGVVTLRNAVFAFFQAGPAGFLERNGVFKSTDAHYFRH